MNPARMSREQPITTPKPRKVRFPIASYAASTVCWGSDTSDNASAQISRQFHWLASNYCILSPTTILEEVSEDHMSNFDLIGNVHEFEPALSLLQ